MHIFPTEKEVTYHDKTHDLNELSGFGIKCSFFFKPDTKNAETFKYLKPRDSGCVDRFGDRNVLINLHCFMHGVQHCVWVYWV